MSLVHTEQTAARVSSPANGFLPIALDTLVPEAVHDFDLYVRNSRQARELVLYRRRGYPLTQADCDRLLERGIFTLHILYDDRDIYADYLREFLLDGEALSPRQKYTVLKEAARSLLSEAACGGSIDAHVRTVDEYSQQMVQTVCNDDFVLQDIFLLMTHDYYSYTHVVNVATYCLAIARTMGGFDERDLTAITAGALLHDIGKRKLPHGLLNKPAKLDEAEKATMQQHPYYGFVDLCRRPDLQWGQLMMVYQHHERVNGKGYPVQITGNEMHPWARLCAVADVFDALTSSRPYRKKMTLSAALEFMERRSGTSFDAELVRCLTSAMRNK